MVHFRSFYLIYWEPGNTLQKTERDKDETLQALFAAAAIFITCCYHFLLVSQRPVMSAIVYPARYMILRVALLYTSI